jgi:CubicO group peptidase (beta-lactamase class C family)
MQRQRIPALSVAVATNGVVSFARTYGTADIENSVPATADTLFRTGSIAKPLTAAAALTLVDSGKLDLDTSVRRYCPVFPEKPWTVTTRELLSHTSGIRNYQGTETDSTKHYSSMTDGFAIFANDPLLFEPGTKYSYATYNYTVAGCVIEGASGERYFDYLREHVLQPAGMTHTVVDDELTIVPHRARGYQLRDGKLLNAGLMDSSYKIPGGGLVTTAEDVVRFAAALIDGKIVKPATATSMWTPTRVPALENGDPSGYGLGLGAFTVQGQVHVSHTGGQQGASTDLYLIPDRRFVVAVLANRDNADPWAIVQRILGFYQMPQPGPASK